MCANKDDVSLGYCCDHVASNGVKTTVNIRASQNSLIDDKIRAVWSPTCDPRGPREGVETISRSGEHPGVFVVAVTEIRLHYVVNKSMMTTRIRFVC